MNLSPHQRSAVERTNQDVCVVAGPGSGKTRVLIERFAWLVEFHHVDPARILAITFTEKAATEIKERLIERFAQSPEHREAVERAWVSTIDGFCARLLQENAVAAGIAPDFYVLEQTEADRLAREAAEESLDELYRERPDKMRRLLEALDLSTDDLGRKPDLAQTLLDVYQSMRVAGVDELPEPQPPADLWPEACRLARQILADRGKTATDTQQLLDWAEAFLALPDQPGIAHFVLEFKANLGRVGKSRSAAAKALKNEILPALRAQWIAERNADLIHLLRDAVNRLNRTYRKSKRAQSALDFADLEEDTVRLLESDYFIRQQSRARFDQILMDELQDTNRLQWRLVNLIRNESDFFAVGDINQSIYGFRHADPAVFEEYRDGLLASGAVVDDLRENHRSRQAILDAVSRVLDGQVGIEPRPLIAAREFPRITGPVVERLVGDSAAIEASLVAARIGELVESGECAYKDIAVLFRSLTGLDVFMRALERFDIPFLTSGGRTFLEAREIRDVLALLAALVNPLDEIALVGVLRSPFVNLSDGEILAAGKQGWQDLFESRFGRLRRLAGFLRPDRILATALDESGYLRALPSRARANVDKLLSFLRRANRPLAEILEDLESGSEAEAPPPEAGDVVKLMTIHAAKGLEFKVVFVSALQKSIDNGSPVIVFSPAAGLGAKWRNPATGGSQEDTAYAALHRERKQREEAEANRLLYVAMTRAAQRLFLTYTRGHHLREWQKLVEPAVASELYANALVSAPALSKTTETEAVQFVAPLALAGQYDSVAAVTHVALFDECPRKYFLQKYIGIESDSEDALSLGSEVHKILAGGASDNLEAQRLAVPFPIPAGATRIEREFDFLYAVEDIVLSGKIDLWYEADGEIVVVDYKTDRVESPETHALQMHIYALALERYLGRRPDRAILFYLRSRRAAEISLSSADLERSLEVVREFSNAQETIEFELREGEHCRRCEFYRGLCPAGKN